MAAGAVAVILAAGAAIVISKAPFRRDSIVRMIGDGSGTRVEVGEYHERWFPPGFTANHVRLTAANGGVITIDSVALYGSYTGLLRSPRVIDSLRTSGLRVQFRSDQLKETIKGLLHRPGSKPMRFREIRLDNAIIRVLRTAPGSGPLEFRLHRVALTNVGPGEAGGFEAALHNPAPPGEIRARGKFGPLNSRDAGQTPVSGDFTFEKADLSVEHGIKGTLNARGTFRREIRALECGGTANVPDFQVYGSSHPVNLAAQFRAIVNARNGDAMVEPVTVRFNHTTVGAAVKVEGARSEAKTVTVDARVQEGRVEDLLILFTSNPAAPMEGAIRLQGKFVIPPGPPEFLKRLTVDGEFRIARAMFTNPGPQTPINRLSASAEGEPKREQRRNPTAAPGEIEGKVSSRNALARLQNVVFTVPGVNGKLAGTFGLEDHRIDFQGNFLTTGKLSDTTSGIKTLLLKAMGPILHREKTVRPVPFAISGTSAKPVFRLHVRD